MSLTLVEKSAQILEFQTKNVTETIAMLEQILAEAISGGITGMAGIFTTTQGELGTFYAGECCKNSSQTICDLYVLHSEILSA